MWHYIAHKWYNFSNIFVSNFPGINLALKKVTWLDTLLQHPEDRTVVDGIDDAYLTITPPSYWMVDLNATVAIDLVFVRMADEKHGLYGHFSPCHVNFVSEYKYVCNN